MFPGKLKLRIKFGSREVSSVLLLVLYVVSVVALTAPTRTQTIGGGSGTTPCTFDNFQDSGKFLGKDCATSKIKFSETSAFLLAQDENSSNVNRYWEPGIWDFSVNGGTEGSINVSNVTDWGVYGQTVFKCSSPGCIAWSIGNQNANDALYHAWNVTDHDLVFDGAGLSNSACYGVTTALTVYAYHDIFQNCYELGTGCMRLTNWNSNQILSHGVYFNDDQFIKCKITLSGAINGYLRNSNFVGLANGAVGSKALVDFSKGDITPTAVNNLANFCFCGNTISGWTLPIFLGFQAVSNDTIAENTIRDASSFLQTTDTSGGIYFEGVTVRNNYYSSATGGISFGYGHSIQLVGNTLSFDTTPAQFSTGISFEKSQDPSVNQNPKNVFVQNNEIYKWGGIGMDLGFTDGIVSGNQIYDVNQNGGNANSNAGILTGTNAINLLISGNSIISDVTSGAGLSRPINYNGGKNLTITGNYLLYAGCPQNSCAVYLAGTTLDPSVQIYANWGENPYGKVANFIQGTNIGICGTGTGIASNTYYTVCTSPILISTSGGSGVTESLRDNNNNQIDSAVAVVAITDLYVPIGYKINIAWSSAPTVTVSGV